MLTFQFPVDQFRPAIALRLARENACRLLTPAALHTAHAQLHNRARKSRRTLQDKVGLKVLPEQLTLFVNTFVAFKKCIIQ